MKKLGLLVLVMVLAVASLGVGYAWWTQTITIGGTIASADFGITTSITSNDPLSTIDPTQTLHVGSTDVEEIDDLNYDIAIANVYPGYTSTLTCTLTNTGSIPVKVYLADFDWTTGYSAALVAVLDDESGYTTGGYTEGDPIAAGATETIIITFVIPESAGDDIINQSASGSISFDVQQFNQP